MKLVLVLHNVLLALAGTALGRPASSSSTTTTPVLPQTGGATNLPQPPSNASKLLFIALGFGIQNYTCPSVGANPVSTGALAMLYDITHLYPADNQQQQQQQTCLSRQDFDRLPSYALRTHRVPLNLNTSSSGRVDPRYPGASTSYPFPPDAPLQLDGLDKPLPFLGHHFFTAAGAPSFVLAKSGIDVVAGKLASVDAPADADKGPDGTGAVAWLLLGAKSALSVGPVKSVYRVETAGGNAHGCAKAAGQDSTRYAAQYWFYG